MLRTNIKTIGVLTLFSLPISASAVINMISSFVAMMMLARVGEEQLAAAAIAVPTFITVTMVAPIFYAVGILISHHRGLNKSTEMIGHLVKNGVWLAFFLSIPASLLLWNAGKILLLLGQDPALIKLCDNYFHYAAFCIFPMLINAVIVQFYSGIGYPRFAFIISLLTLPPTLVLLYALILGKFGFPALALGGITSATLIIQTLTCIAILIYMMFEQITKPYQLFTGTFAPDWTLLQGIFTLGFPIGIQFGGELAAMTVSAYLMGYFGVIALAATQVVSQYGILVVMISLGLSQGLSILISKAYGENNLFLVKEYLDAAMVLLSGFFFFVLILFWFNPTMLISVFISKHDTDNQQIIMLAVYFFIIAVFTLYADGIRNILSGTLRGLHDSKAPMNIGIICLWLISLPLSYVIAFLMHGGPIGLRLGFMTGFIVAAIVLWNRTQNKIHTLQLDSEKHEKLQVLS